MRWRSPVSSALQWALSPSPTRRASPTIPRSAARSSAPAASVGSVVASGEVAARIEVMTPTIRV